MAQGIILVFSLDALIGGGYRFLGRFLDNADFALKTGK